MEKQPVRIVTDGAVELAPETISTLGIGIVPRQLQAGKTTYESNEETPLPVLGQTLSPSKARVLSPIVNDFLQAYRRFEPAPILSIHPAETLDDAAHFARLARNLLTAHPLTTYYDAQGALRYLRLPQSVTEPPEIHVFEASTIDLGMRLLVTAAAQSARDGRVVGKLDLLLHRLQTEMLQTWVLTKNTSRLSVADTPTAGARSMLRRLLPGMETLLRLERATGRFEVVERGRNLAKTLAARPELFQGIPQPCEIWIRQRGYAKEVQQIASQLQTACQAERVNVEHDSLAAAPYFASNYIELVLGPTPEAIERVIKFTDRVWGRFGVSGSLTGTH